MHKTAHPRDGDPRSRVEILTEQFYAWEHRGRGWQVWDTPVELEPLYTPFGSFSVPPSRTGHDDGQQPTLGSAFADGIKRLILGPWRRGHTDDERTNEEEPALAHTAETIAEFRVSVPPKLSVGREVVESFLQALPSAIHPLSFEIIGTTDAVTLQFACDAADAGSLVSRLRAHFPDIVVVPQEGFLSESWASVEGESVCIDFGLSNEFMLPLRTPRRFDVDPLTGVIASLSDLREGEIGVLQVLFQQARHNWISSIERVVHDGAGGSFFLDVPHLPAMTREKVSRPLFGTVLRLAVRCSNFDRANEIVRAVSGALSAFGDPMSNELIPLDNENYDDVDHEAGVLARTSHRSGMLLNLSELVSLVHPPDASVRISKLRREERKTKAAPAIAIGNELTLGTNVHASLATDVTLNSDQRSRHVYVVGASGTGKSTLLLNLITQDLERGEGLAVLDPHGDLIEEVLARIPEKRIDDVALLDPSDAEYPIGINILQAHTDLEKTLLASDLVSVFRRLSSSWGDQMNAVLANAILAFLESDRGGTLRDLRRFLVEREYRREFLTTVRDPECVYYWEKEFPLLSHKPHGSILTRLNTFLRHKLVRHMVVQPESRLDFASTMNDGKILLVKLAQGAIGVENAALLGTIIVTKLHQIAMSRQERAREERRPFYVYIDEFHNFVTPSMAEILTGARKFGLGLTLAHHGLRQISSRSPEVLDSILTNPFARVCFRVGDQDARVLEDSFASFDRSDLLNLGTGQAICRIERRDYDFNLDTAPASTVERKVAEERRRQAVASSREKFACTRAEVEALSQVEAPVAVAPPTLPDEGETIVESPIATHPVEPSVVREPSASQPLPRTVPTPPAGRGGQQHRYFQHLIKQWGDKNGWRTTIEEGVLEGGGSVDVSLRKGDRSIACEIAMTTTPEHEAGNIEKCLAAGFEHVILVSTKKSTLNKVRNLAGQHLSDSTMERIEFVKADEILMVLERFDAALAGRETTVKGYKVKVQYKAIDDAEKKVRQEAISRVFGKALRRFTGDD